MTPEKGDAQLQQYSFSMSGTSSRNKTAYSLSAGGARIVTVVERLRGLPMQHAAGAARQPQDGLNLFGRLDHMITRPVALRASFDFIAANSENLGVGISIFPSGATSSRTRNGTLRLSENGPLGEVLLGVTVQSALAMNTEQRSDPRGPHGSRQRRVHERRARGARRRSDTTFELASEPRLREGQSLLADRRVVEGGSYHSDDTSNYLGTYTFASLADYNAGKPPLLAAHRHPDLTYSNCRSPVRAGRLAGGAQPAASRCPLRLEAHVGDAQNFSGG